MGRGWDACVQQDYGYIIHERGSRWSWGIYESDEIFEQSPQKALFRVWNVTSVYRGHYIALVVNKLSPFRKRSST